VVDIGTLFTLALVGIWLFAVIDVFVSDKDEIRNLPKWAWLVVVVLFMALGAVLWFLLGRPKRLFSGPSVDAPRAARRPRPTRVDRAEEEAQIQANIAERDRLLAQWAEEERRKGTGGQA
jgi:hypothetical protein